MSERPTLELSADQVRADGEAFLIAMPGEDDPTCVENWPICVNGGYDPRCCRFPKSCSVDKVAPSVLVALNQPCPSCEGRSHVGQDRSHMCPDCGGSGRLVFDFKTPCDVCHGDWEGYRFEDSEPFGDGWLVCEHCDQGTVVHRVWLDPEWGIRRTNRCARWDRHPESYEARAITVT